MTIRLTDRNFEQEVLGSEIPVLVEFWASWCLPCKQAEPILEELSELYEGRVKVGKLNVDQNPRMRDRYGIAGLPTFCLFDSGGEIARRVGAQARHQLIALIEQKLGRSEEGGSQ